MNPLQSRFVFHAGRYVKSQCGTSALPFGILAMFVYCALGTHGAANSADGFSSPSSSPFSSAPASSSSFASAAEDFSALRVTLVFRQATLSNLAGAMKKKLDYDIEIPPIYQKDRMDILVRDEPVARVLDKIGSENDFVWWVDGKTITFENRGTFLLNTLPKLPIEKALARLSEGKGWGWDKSSGGTYCIAPKEGLSAEMPSSALESLTKNLDAWCVPNRHAWWRTPANGIEIGSINDYKNQVLHWEDDNINPYRAETETLNAGKRPSGSILSAGESFMAGNVQVTFEADSAVSPSMFRCRIQKAPAPPLVVSNKKLAYAYIDETCFCINHEKVNSQRARISYYKQPRVYPVMPYAYNGIVYISRGNPVSIGGIELSVPEKMARGADGIEYLQLQITNLKSNQTLALQGINGNMREMGRFSFEIYAATAETQTIVASFKAERDPDDKGADAIVQDNFIIEHGPLEAQIDAISKRFDIEVEWLEYPGHPESIAHLKKLNGSGRNISQSTLRQILNMHLRSDCEASWASKTKIRIWASRYSDTLRQSLIAELQDAEKARMMGRFNRDFSLQTKVYPLKNISASVAKALVEPKLAAFWLVCLQRANDSQRQSLESPVIATMHKGVFHSIIAVQGASVPGAILPNSAQALESLVIDGNTEISVADEKSNSLIVTAVPKTHEAIQVTLSDMEKKTSPQDSQGAPARYSIELVLLQGVAQIPPAAQAAKNEPAAITKMAPKRKPSVTSPNTVYRILIVDNLDMDTANNVVEKLRRAGYLGVSLSEDASGKCSVLLESFPSMKKAAAEMERLEKEEGLACKGVIAHKVETNPAFSRESVADSENSFINAIKTRNTYRVTFKGSYTKEEADRLRKMLEEDGYFPIEVKQDPQSAEDSGYMVSCDIDFQNNQDAQDLAQDLEQDLERKGHNGKIVVEKHETNHPPAKQENSAALVGEDISLKSEALEKASDDSAPGVSDSSIFAAPSISSSSIPSECSPPQPTGIPYQSAAEALKKHGLSADDLKMFHFQGIIELGQAFLALAAERGELGKAQIALSDSYYCIIEYQGERPPYLIVRGRLGNSQTQKVLLENTVYLESGKPALLGVTNLNQALILVLKWNAQPQAAH